jgi:hypothetical protein
MLDQKLPTWETWFSHCGFFLRSRVSVSETRAAYRLLILMASGLRPSMGVFILQKSENHGLEVEEQVPVLDVIKVIGDSFC